MANLNFKLQIACDNAAFEDDASAEIARILRDVANRVERGECRDYDKFLSLRDVNGNPVGTFRLRDESNY